MKYVLLVGGMTSLITGDPRDDANQGTQDWWLPVRYTNNQEMGSTHDPGFISDLYYAYMNQMGVLQAGRKIKMEKVMGFLLIGNLELN